MKLSKKGKMMAAILGIAFIAYNVTLFTLCGFTGHTAVFWVSWIFMVAAFAAMAGSCAILRYRGLFLRDWLFGFPMIKHSTVYIIAELLASSAFILFEKAARWNWAFGVQFFLLCIHGVCAVSCFLAKETIDEVKAKVSDNTRLLKILRLDAASLVEKCDDPKTREACRQLAEALRYSDPMGCAAVSELEQEIARTLASCDKAVEEKDFGEARELCAQAMRQLSQRNRMCQAMK